MHLHPRSWSWPVFLTTLGLWAGYHAVSIGGLVLLGGELGSPRSALISLGAIFFPLSLLAPAMLARIRAYLHGDRRWAGMRRTLALLLAALVVHATLYSLAARHLEPGLVRSWWAVLTFLLLSPYALTFAACAAYAGFLHAQEQKRALLSAQLRMLRAQLQPHFLFNTLHAIGVTAQGDGATAARMLTLLGDMLRDTLRAREQALVSLAEEHHMLQPYLELQQLRFSDRLRLDLDLDRDTLGAKVPDLILQPLVENALQHGIERKPGPGTVRIRSRRHGDQLLLEVQDDGVGLGAASPEQATGTGLATTRERLAALFGEHASLELRGNAAGGTTATLRLPYREEGHAA